MATPRKTIRDHAGIRESALADLEISTMFQGHHSQRVFRYVGEMYVKGRAIP